MFSPRPRKRCQDHPLILHLFAPWENWSQRVIFLDSDETLRDSGAQIAFQSETPP